MPLFLIPCIYGIWAEHKPGSFCSPVFLLFTGTADNKKAFFIVTLKYKNMSARTWLDKHKETLTYGQRIADSVAKGMGSWGFIIVQSVFVCIWMTMNIIGFIRHWDPYPFILLNLIFSTQAAYAAPIIMMSQNRQSERDRLQAMADFDTNLEAKLEIEALQRQLNKIETEKLDKIMAMLEEIKKGN